MLDTKRETYTERHRVANLERGTKRETERDIDTEHDTKQDTQRDTNKWRERETH